MIISGSSVILKQTFYNNKGETVTNTSNLPEDFMIAIYCKDGNAIATGGYDFKNNGNQYQYNGIIGNSTGRNPSIKVDNYYKYRINVDPENTKNDSLSDAHLYYIIGGSIAAVLIIVITIIIICCCCCKKSKDESIQP